MKLLVFEYICGGGYFSKTLPGSLANEGRRMLQALLNELKLNKQIDILLLLDPRFSDLDVPVDCVVIWVSNSDFWATLDNHIGLCDAVLPIAPEQDGLLAMIATRIQVQRKHLWLSDPESVCLCSRKLQTLEYLAQQALPVIETKRLSDHPFTDGRLKVLKPNDGLGCEGSFITNDVDNINFLDSDNWIVQDFVEGDALSLSAICAQGRGYLICCNRQHIQIVHDSFKFRGCSVNIQHPMFEQFEAMVQQIAQCMPGLWGYIGIDLIVSPQYGPLILEINPRLTTSYVGIYQATGVAVHLQLYNLCHGLDPDFSSKWQTNVEISL